MAARRSFFAAVAIVSVGLALASSTRADTVPEPVVSAVHGRIVGWTRSPPNWFAVYVEGKGGGWCGLDGASWWIALVRTPTPQSAPTTASAQRLGGAMCGNTLAWVRAGRFSDGRHREVAFMLWATPSIGATTYVYRIEGNRLERLAAIPGDRVTLGHGTVTARFENAGRSPDDRSVDRYVFRSGRYRLA